MGRLSSPRTTPVKGDAIGQVTAMTRRNEYDDALMSVMRPAAAAAPTLHQHVDWPAREAKMIDQNRGDERLTRKQLSSMPRATTLNTGCDGARRR
jgi:hypothetical protein